MTIDKITIITPSLNQGKYLESTICSVLDQNYPNLEYFVIDGGSTDSSVEIIKKYQDKIDYWVSEKDSGQSNAINKGLKKATGKIITWVNSDDMLHPGILSKIPSYFNQTDVGLIFGKTISFGDNTYDKISSYDLKDLNAKLLGRVTFPQPASFFRAEILEQHGLLDESLHYGMDYDLFVRIALNFKIKPIEEIVSLNRYHPESKSIASTFKFASDWAKVFSKILRSFDFTEEIIADMRELKLYYEGSDFYKVGFKFDKKELQRAYLYFLQEQAQLYYSSYQMKEAKLIVIRIQVLDYEFYSQYKLNHILFRSSFLPVNLIKLFKFLRFKIRNKNQYGW